MASLLESLTFEQRIGLVTLCSAVLVLLAVWCSGLVGWPVRQLRTIRRWCAFAAPLTVAYVSYWLPVWIGADDDVDQAHAWALLGVGGPFLPALIASAAIVWLAEMRLAPSSSQPRGDERDTDKGSSVVAQDRIDRRNPS